MMIRGVDDAGGGGETARSGPSWSEWGQISSERGMVGRREVFWGADDNVGDVGGVYHTHDGETARAWGSGARWVAGNKQGCRGRDGDVGGEQRVSTGVDGIIGDLAGV
jgi:hypothetical protein